MKIHRIWFKDSGTVFNTFEDTGECVDVIYGDNAVVFGHYHDKAFRLEETVSLPNNAPDDLVKGIEKYFNCEITYIKEHI